MAETDIRAPLPNPARSEMTALPSPDHSPDRAWEILATWVASACDEFGPRVSASELLAEVQAQAVDGSTRDELAELAILTARAHIEEEPSYTYVAARLLLHRLYDAVLGYTGPLAGTAAAYRAAVTPYIHQGITAGLLDPALAGFDLDRLASALEPGRDRLFAYPGLQTLVDRYLLRLDDRIIELPQLLWLRVAMGLALREPHPTERAIEFYEVMSTFRFTPATPTLFHAGTPHPQLSSCYLTTIADDLGQIFKCLRDNALLSKWAGGLGNDWTRIRARGALIHGTQGRSQGVIPFLKIANDVAVAVNQGGKRQGPCAPILRTGTSM